MKKIFLIEDDPVVVEIYRKKFLREGYHVDIAEDGLAAMKQLSVARPDLVVLDLMIPKFNGADVLKFIRSNKELKHVKVVIFSNAYMTEVALEAAKSGADASLLKSSSTPQQLLNLIKTLLEGGSVGPEFRPTAIAADAELPPVAPTKSPAPLKHTTEGSTATSDYARPFTLPPAEDADLPADERARRNFSKNAPATLAELRELFEAFAHPTEPQFRLLRLMDLHRKIHFFTDLAALAQRRRIAHLSGALEALLYELQERPKHINPSTVQSVEAALNLLAELLTLPDESESPLATNLLAVLVVDDEALSNRALVHALSRANVKAQSTDDSAKALELSQKNHYDLLLLDYVMPGMDGLELYNRLRALPEYKTTPVIFVTSATDFRQRAQDFLSRGDDVIIKPIIPMELAVKALTHLMKNRLEEKK